MFKRNFLYFYFVSFSADYSHGVINNGMAEVALNKKITHVSDLQGFINHLSGKLEKAKGLNVSITVLSFKLIRKEKS